MPRFIDLDEFAPQPVRVQIHGTVYKLPGDVDVPDYFLLEQLSTRIVEGDDPVEAVQALHDKLLELFQVHQPKLTKLPVGPRLLLPLVFKYLNTTDADEVPEEEADTVRPTRRASTTKKPSGARRSKTTTSRTRSRTGSGSPSS